jgi:hypothetical protein
MCPTVRTVEDVHVPPEGMCTDTLHFRRDVHNAASGLSRCDHNSSNPQHITPLIHFYPSTLFEQAGVFRTFGIKWASYGPNEWKEWYTNYITDWKIRGSIPDAKKKNSVLLYNIRISSGHQHASNSTVIGGSV